MIAGSLYPWFWLTWQSWSQVLSFGVPSPMAGHTPGFLTSPSLAIKTFFPWELRTWTLLAQSCCMAAFLSPGALEGGSTFSPLWSKSILHSQGHRLVFWFSICTNCSLSHPGKDQWPQAVLLFLFLFLGPQNNSSQSCTPGFTFTSRTLVHPSCFVYFVVESLEGIFSVQEGLQQISIVMFRITWVSWRQRCRLRREEKFTARPSHSQEDELLFINSLPRTPKSQPLELYN